MAAPARTTLPGQRRFVDLHCHTRYSFDSLSDPRALVRAAAQRGLTDIAITDHERIDGALAARRAAPAGLRVIVGQEVRTLGGDLVGLFLERAIAPGMTILEAAAAIREQGGLVGLAHPFDRFRASGGRRVAGQALSELLELVDYVEAYNGRIMLGDGNRRAAEMAHANGLPGVSVSDAHTVLEVGVSYTIFDRPFATAAQLRDALPHGQLVMGRASRLVRAGMPLAKGIQWLRGNRRIEAGTIEARGAER